MSEIVDPNFCGVIPANPPVGNTLKHHNRVIESSTTSVRDRATVRHVIPPPPVDERVEVAPPCVRRNFGNGPSIAGRPVRKD